MYKLVKNLHPTLPLLKLVELGCALTEVKRFQLSLLTKMRRRAEIHLTRVVLKSATLYCDKAKLRKTLSTVPVLICI